MTEFKNKFQFMNPSNVYWSAPQTQTWIQDHSGHLGFQIQIPYPDPVSTPFWYGEGNEKIEGIRQLSFSTLPELFTVGGVLPHTAGYPRVNPKSLAGTFSREKHTVKF